MLTTSLLNETPGEEFKEEEELKPENTSITASATSYLGSYYGSISSIFSSFTSFFSMPAQSHELINARALLSQHCSQQYWYAKQIEKHEVYLSALNLYLAELEELNLLAVNQLKGAIEHYLQNVELLKDTTISSERRSEILYSMHAFHVYATEKRIIFFDPFLLNLKNKLEDYISLVTSTEHRDTPEFNSFIVDYIFCDDLYRILYLDQDRVDNEIFTVLMEFRSEFISREMNCSSFELKFHNTGILRMLNDKVEKRIAECLKEIAESTVAHEFHTQEIKHCVEKIRELENDTDEEHEASEEHDVVNDGRAYQSLSGSM